MPKNIRQQTLDKLIANFANEELDANRIISIVDSGQLDALHCFCSFSLSAGQTIELLESNNQKLIDETLERAKNAYTKQTVLLTAVHEMDFLK